MRAKEFLQETNADKPLRKNILKSGPYAKRYDDIGTFYDLYRFGVAIAGAKGASQRAKDDVPPYEKESGWGENEIVVSYDPHVVDYIHDALRAMGLPPSDAERIGTQGSEEAPDVDKTSPIKGFKGY